MTGVAKERTLSSLTIGEEAEILRTVTAADVDAFARVSGDENPLHMDESFAATAGFKGRVVHGMFLGALVSQLVGMHFPGRHALLIKETLEFKKPLFIGDTVRVRGTLTMKSDATRLIEITIAAHRDDEVVAGGSATVRVLT
jgi:acyl dehydratase